jgi:hypothetical protein
VFEVRLWHIHARGLAVKRCPWQATVGEGDALPSVRRALTIREEKMMDDRLGGQAVIEDGRYIVIRVAIEALPAVVEGAWASGGLDTRFKVTDPAAFAKELVIEINQEDEAGTTAVHKMFDFSINMAIEQGAEGIEEHEIQEV